jgi:hypothetical protein
MTQDLAESIKRLRAKYYDGGETMKTINQLVELVAEMQKAMGLNCAGCSQMHHSVKDRHSMWDDCPVVFRYEQVQKKANALLSGLKEDTK